MEFHCGILLFLVCFGKRFYPNSLPASPVSRRRGEEKQTQVMSSGPTRSRRVGGSRAKQTCFPLIPHRRVLLIPDTSKQFDVSFHNPSLSSSRGSRARIYDVLIKSYFFYLSLFITADKGRLWFSIKILTGC